MNYAHLTMAIAVGFLLGFFAFLYFWNPPPGDDD